MASKYFKAFNFFKSKVSPTIKSVKPTFPKTKMSQALRDVKITALKTKGSIKKGSQDLDRDIQKVKSKIGQTMQKLKGEPVTKSGVSKGKDLREKKMGGGMMGRRMGYSQGSSKGKIPTTPKEKSLAKLAPPKDRITFGDVVAGRTKGKRMQAKDGTIPFNKQKSIIDKQGKRGNIVGMGTIQKLPSGNMSEEKRISKSKRKQPFKTIKNTPGPQFKKDRKRKIGSNVYGRKP